LKLPSFAQHFLRSPALVKELLGHTTITKKDVVYDIGAGSGVVTSALAKVAQSVVSVELDPRMVAKLRENIRHSTNVSVVQADFLTLPLPRTPYKVFANIPFGVSSQIVQRLTGAPVPPAATYLIVQEQFARKLLPDNKGYTNQLGITLGVEFGVRIRRKLKPTDFSPPPHVPTVLVEIVHRSVPLVGRSDLLAFKQFVTRAFTDPRSLWQAPLHTAGLSAIAPPSSLTLDQWVQLYEIIRHTPPKHEVPLLAPNDPFLAKKAQPVAPNEINAPSTRFVIARLAEVVASKGRQQPQDVVAAPRLGISKRIVAVGGGPKRALVIINPVVNGRAVTGLDHNGKPLRVQLTGQVAQSLMREIRLLDGR
jgi:23S rRNA (adenine-N6)-dimethyltransferase